MNQKYEPQSLVGKQEWLTLCCQEIGFFFRKNALIL